MIKFFRKIRQNSRMKNNENTIMLSNCKFLFLLSLFIFPVSFISGQSADPLAAGMSSERLERYHDYLAQEIVDGKVPGAVSIIYRKGQIAHFEAQGFSNVADKTPMEKDQIFSIASMTKAVVTTAFMMLYEEGHFLLNDPVEIYLPQFKDPVVILDPETGNDGATELAKGPIRIIHLLTHTSGLSHGLTATKFDAEFRRAVTSPAVETIEDRVNAMAALPLIGHPGEQWFYSASPDVLSLLIEHFSGMSTIDFLQERLFGPLGMEDTFYNVPKTKQDRMAMLHVADSKGQVSLNPQQMPMEGNTVYGGRGGLFSTASDYIKFCQLYLNKGRIQDEQLLSPKTIELMTENHVGELYVNPGYGFSIGFALLMDLSETHELGTVGQISWGGAYRTYFFIDPEEDMAAVLMTQVSPFRWFYRDKMRQLIYQAIVD
jgi:CubicO group peptidase (beta-lactamase class C family)